MQVEYWGEIPYGHAHQRQRQYVEEILAGERDETILVCSHPSVVTLGRQSTEEDLRGWQGEVHWVERGGKATYHGPGQVICYPLINLKNRGQDLGQYLSALEGAVVSALAHYQVQAHGSSQRGNPQWTGVWTASQKKLASVGIAVKKGVTYHGLACNLYCDPQAFQGINPCGYSPQTMISLEDLIQRHAPREQFENYLLDALIPGLPQ